MNLVPKEEAKKIIEEAGKDVESGMEYLQGLECDLIGMIAYERKDIDRFITR